MTAHALMPSPLDRLFGGVLRAAAALTSLWGGAGFRHAVSLVRRMCGGRGLVAVSLNDDSRFVFPLGDRYWSRPLLSRGERYEPEIEWLMRSARTKPYGLLDCGANMGYWSVLASSAAYGRRPAVAIEASRANFDLLVNNAQLNGGRFRAVHQAIWDESGKTLKLHGERHEGRSLRADWSAGGASEDVETISLDDAADRYLPDRSFPLLVKLDVEGVEIEAFKGGRRLIAEGALIAYEDHGKEPTHPVSQFVMSLGDVEIWNLEQGRTPKRVASLEQMSAIKRDRKRGYNFFAFRSGSPWAALFQGNAQPVMG
jgi:FkbM family methyltransferase